MPYSPLTRSQIASALRRLGELAQAEGVTLEISLYGGAVFTLVYGSREATKDVDAIARQDALAKTLARRVAAEQGLAEDWLNDHVKYFVSEREAKRRLTDGEFGPGLRVSVPTAAYLLALKLRSCRPPLPGYAGDYADIRFLVRKMELQSIEEAVAIQERFFPEDPLSEIAKGVVREAIGPTK